jgi:hypothetical protein
VSTVKVKWFGRSAVNRREERVMPQRAFRARWVAMCGTVLVTVLLWPAAAPAGATDREHLRPRHRHLDRQVSGPFEGVPFLEAHEGCSFFYERFVLEYVADSGGTGTLQIEGCVLIDGFVYEGGFTLTTPGGAVLRGTASGTARPFALVLTVTSSEGRGFRNVRGTIGLSGDWNAGIPGFPGSPGPPSASGTLVGDLGCVRR